MGAYNFYFTFKGYHLTGVAMHFECADDVAAIKLAREILSTVLNKSDGMETWEGNRKVANARIGSAAQSPP